MTALPTRFEDVEALETFMSEPTPGLVADLARIDGDIMVLGVGGKMGPTLARMARRAAPGRRVIGVARFSDPALKASLERQGVECIACDLLDRDALQRLPKVADGVRNMVFMAGHKFGAAGNPSLTWMMNVGVPAMVAETFREMRIVTFSTAWTYSGGASAPENLTFENPGSLILTMRRGRSTSAPSATTSGSTRTANRYSQTSAGTACREASSSEGRRRSARR